MMIRIDFVAAQQYTSGAETSAAELKKQLKWFSRRIKAAIEGNYLTLDLTVDQMSQM